MAYSHSDANVDIDTDAKSICIQNNKLPSPLVVWEGCIVKPSLHQGQDFAKILQTKHLKENVLTSACTVCT